MSAKSRNEKAKSYVLKKIKQIRLKPPLHLLKKYKKEAAILEQLIPIKANGFRGVVLTVIVGIDIDNNFDATNDFYACNPRSIFEQGIYFALEESGIPCGKSDPLNVAKNIQQLDENWAKRKKPESAAMAAVDYIRLLNCNKKSALFEDLIDLFFMRLVQYADYNTSRNFPVSTVTLQAPSIVIARKLSRFVLECSEGGSNTQYICGLLIRYLRQTNPMYRAVLGVEESVFGTNTTSKKPADIWEIYSNGSYGSLYEITTKAIDRKRLDDCVSSLKLLELNSSIITFVCDIPDNLTSIETKDGCLIYKGTFFQFLDIRSFIVNIFCLLTHDERTRFILELQSYIFSTNRAVKSKEWWASEFS